MSFLTIVKGLGIITVLIYAQGPPEKEIVRTKSGDVRGIKEKAEDSDVWAYLGIPYAVPPVGEMRFRESTPVKPWEGVYNADKLPHCCVQKLAVPIYEWQPTNTTNYNEDCLYLNIWVPANGEETGKKAVMVWIHGGGYDTGCTNLDVYDGRHLAAGGDVIVVAINYRLGVIGFLYVGNEDAPGNMGMKDQVLAMRWVKDNIEAFGGDPSRITIFGESVGSISVSTHLISPETKGLFSSAIMQSGTAFQAVLFPGPSVGIAMSSQVSSDLGCLDKGQNITSNSSEVVDCLRKLPAEDIAAAGRKLEGPMMTSFIPLSGDDYLPRRPLEDFEAGNIHDVPILIGNVRDEGSFFLGYLDPPLLQIEHPIITKEQGAKYIKDAFQQVTNPPSNVTVEYYLGDVPENDHRLIIKRVYDATGDWLLYCPCIYLSETFSTQGREAYHYFFNHTRKVPPFKEWLGVPHFEESPFIFGTHLQLNNSYTPEDIEFSKTLIRIWASFAKYGKPSSGLLAVEWPPYSKEKPAAIDLNPDDPKIVNPNKKECQFWRKFL